MATTVGQRVRTPAIQMIGEAQEVFSQRAAAKREEMRLQNVPAYTVINFNPIELKLDGIFKGYPVANPYDKRLPENVGRVVMNWRGRDYVGHILVIRDPFIDGRNVGARSVNGQPAMQGGGETVVEREVVAYPPAAIAYSLLEHYSPIFSVPADGRVAPPPTNVRRICGVLAFEGRLDAISPEVLQKRNGMIRVPVARMLTIGRTSQRVIETVEYPLAAWKDQMFEGQRRYADMVISRAQQKFVEGKGREEIGSAERTWYRWAIDMGYTPRPKDPDKTWLNELISLTNLSDEELREPLRKCQACRKPEPEPGTPFCSCGSPIHTFTTFMAGFPVAMSWLMALQGEERDLAIAEYQRRQQGFEGAQEDGPAKMPAAKPTGRGAGGKPVKRGEEIPSAASTAMPGEE